MWNSPLPSKWNMNPNHGLRGSGLVEAAKIKSPKHLKIWLKIDQNFYIVYPFKITLYNPKSNSILKIPTTTKAALILKFIIKVQK